MVVASGLLDTCNYKFQFKPLWEICYVIMISYDCMFYTDAFTGIECGMGESAVSD